MAVPLFQSTPSVKRATIFGIAFVNKWKNFNPHPLWRGRRGTFFFLKKLINYFNPHPLWRGRPDVEKFKQILQGISIHTLCEEGDVFLRYLLTWALIFQSTPSVKRATGRATIISTHSAFQSTPSVKRATINTHKILPPFLYFNPHPLWRGRPGMTRFFGRVAPISIHTLCEEGDTIKIIM